nr:immunoglobulin light chain junction region [Macaca mulatta]MOX42292.1 immunoglobulin light chain junction region [Macaca mulatta]MOX43640.1 immunoglobulin light chain junction region [Macaca mulatta]MOX44483.1 immunoglobulin light chain junction region [Macaca mulatta]MOX44487.1 immunoglobulin light chain junction region [Macaca mulatta]
EYYCVIWHNNAYWVF